MKEYRIALGDHLRDELRWLVLYRSNKPESFQKGDTIILDFSKVSFIIPYCLLGLLAFITTVFKKTKVKVLLINIPTTPSIYQYLERSDFFKLVCDKVKIVGDYSEVVRWDRDHASRKMHGIIEIERNRLASANKIAETINELKSRYEDIFGFFSENHRNGNLFFTILSEITANIPEHSDSNGYLLVQKYESQNRKTVSTSLSIMDTGIGIRGRIEKQILEKTRKPLKKTAEDSDFIKYAFSEKGTRSGAGLNSVINSLNGWDPHDTAILVLSGRGMMYKVQDSKDLVFTDEQLFFQGTHATIWFYGDL